MVVGYGDDAIRDMTGAHEQRVKKDSANLLCREFLLIFLPA